jgi:inner membrane protein
VDNLCHTLVGAACGEAGLKRTTRLGTATLLIASNLPDLDVLVFATDMPSVAFRRGWTHGVLAQALLPLAFAGVMYALGCSRIAGAPRHLMPAPAGRGSGGAAHRRADFGALLLLSYIGVLSHVALDLLNNYGVRLLMPFSGRWFYGDSVFIVDIWLWLALGIGVGLARRRGRSTPARTALLLASAYIAALVISAGAARQFVLDRWRDERGVEPHGLMVGPVPVTPFRRAVIVDAGDHYRTGTFRWFPREVALDPEPVPKRDGHPAVRAARETDADIRAVLVWSRFPYYDIAPGPGGTVVTLRDLRFGDRVGGVRAVVAASPDSGHPADRE